MIKEVLSYSPVNSFTELANHETFRKLTRNIQSSWRAVVLKQFLKVSDRGSKFIKSDWNRVYQEAINAEEKIKASLVGLLDIQATNDNFGNSLELELFPNDTDHFLMSAESKFDDMLGRKRRRATDVLQDSQEKSLIEFFDNKVDMTALFVNESKEGQINRYKAAYNCFKAGLLRTENELLDQNVYCELSETRRYWKTAVFEKIKGSLEDSIETLFGEIAVLFVHDEENVDKQVELIDNFKLYLTEQEVKSNVMTKESQINPILVSLTAKLATSVTRNIFGGAKKAAFLRSDLFEYFSFPSMHLELVKLVAEQEKCLADRKELDKLLEELQERFNGQGKGKRFDLMNDDLTRQRESLMCLS